MGGVTKEAPQNVPPLVTQGLSQSDYLLPSSSRHSSMSPHICWATFRSTNLKQAGDSSNYGGDLSESYPDTAVLVFPPSSVEGGSVEMSATLLVTGKGTMSCPPGNCSLFSSSFCLRVLSTTDKSIVSRDILCIIFRSRHHQAQQSPLSKYCSLISGKL